MKNFDYFKQYETKVLNYLNIEQEDFKYSRNDGKIIDHQNKKIYIIEFKFRQIPDFKYKTYFLEKKKYNDLVLIAKDYKDKYKDYKIFIYYINLFNNDKIYIFNLKVINKHKDYYYESSRYMNAVTADGTYRSGLKVNKEVYELYRNRAYKVISI